MTTANDGSVPLQPAGARLVTDEIAAFHERNKCNKQRNTPPATEDKATPPPPPPPFKPTEVGETTPALSTDKDTEPEDATPVPPPPPPPFEDATPSPALDKTTANKTDANDIPETANKTAPNNIPETVNNTIPNNVPEYTMEQKVRFMSRFLKMCLFKVRIQLRIDTKHATANKTAPTVAEAFNNDSLEDDSVAPRPWEGKVDGVDDEINLSDSDDDEIPSNPKSKKTKSKKTKSKTKKTKKTKKKNKKASKGISAKGLTKLKEMQAAFVQAKQGAKESMSERPIRPAKKQAIANMAMAGKKSTTKGNGIHHDAETLKKLKQQMPAVHEEYIKQHPSEEIMDDNAAAEQNATEKSDDNAGSDDDSHTTMGDNANATERSDDPLWDDDDNLDDQEKEEEEEELIEPKVTPKKKKRKNRNNDEEEEEEVATKLKRKKKAEKEKRECWPERKAWVHPETLKQMMDVTTRGKVKALKKPMEILQYATLPHARTDECEEEKTTAARTTGAVREQLGWPWNIHGAFHFCEQKPNASGNTTKTRFLDVPELHFWVGSDSASEKLLEIMNGKQEAKIHVHTEFDSYVGHFQLPENKRPENKRGK